MADFGTRWKNEGQYREGGQAHTFKVRDENDPIAEIKILKRLKNPKRTDRFNQEIEAGLLLSHPNILSIIDRGETDNGKPYFVTPFCSEGNLEDSELPSGSPLEILRVFRQVCIAVAYAHSKGVIHRDLKPENIFLNAAGDLIVGDFGICLIESAIDSQDRMTSTMEVMGSRWYCAPELRDGRLESGVSQAPADVYSLGKVLYWMLSGKQMFDREDHRNTRYRLGRNDESNQAYELINELLDQTIVSERAKRLANAGALLSELDDLISVIERGGHAISIHVPHRCIFCARGTYQIVVHALEYACEAANALSLFGWQAPINHAKWLIMVCDLCGNIQTFRPDIPSNKHNGFSFQKITDKVRRWTSKRNQ